MGKDQGGKALGSLGKVLESFTLAFGEKGGGRAPTPHDPLNGERGVTSRHDCSAAFPIYIIGLNVCCRPLGLFLSSLSKTVLRVRVDGASLYPN